MTSDENDLIEELFKEFYSPLYRYAEISLENADLAQDIVQDVFHEALRHREQLASHENPRGWLMQTLKYKLHTSERQRRRLAALFRSLEDLPEHRFSVDAHEPEEDVNVLIAKIKQALSEDEFYLLKRFAIDQASHCEIAEELGITVWASQKRLTRIREKLRFLFPERRKKSLTIHAKRHMLFLPVFVFLQYIFK